MRGLRADLTAIVVVLAASAAVSVSGLWPGECVKVADGDTITVAHGGRAEVIRLWGVDCPESQQAFGAQARAYTADLCLGKSVLIRPIEHDQYGRTVATVILASGSSLAADLVRDGYAWWYRYYAPKATELRDLEGEARAGRLGLWAAPNPVAPWDFRRR
jgi:micrococcal nuclease